MDIKRDLFVRTFMLAGAVKQRGPFTFDISGSDPELRLMAGTGLITKLQCFIVIERNEDTRPHMLRAEWMAPDGRMFGDLGAVPLGMGSVEFVFTEVRIEWPDWMAGEYRLVLFIDEVPVSAAPLRLVKDNSEAFRVASRGKVH